MVIVAWIVAGLVIAFLFYRSHLQFKRLQDTLEPLSDRLSSFAARTEEQLAALEEQRKALMPAPAESPASVPVVSSASTPAESPNGKGSSEEDENLKVKFQSFLDNEINPAVAAHGGFVTLIDIQERVAFVQMGGGCQGCGMVNVTLKQGIEARMNEVMPEIKELVDTTDHRGGTNPYYQPGKGSPMM